MNKRHAVYEYHTENSQLDVYHGSTYTPTTDVLCAMTGSKNLRAPHDWPHHDSCGFTSAYTKSGFAVASLEARS